MKKSAGSTILCLALLIAMLIYFQPIRGLNASTTISTSGATVPINVQIIVVGISSYSVDTTWFSNNIAKSLSSTFGKTTYEVSNSFEYANSSIYTMIVNAALNSSRNSTTTLANSTTITGVAIQTNEMISNIEQTIGLDDQLTQNSYTIVLADLSGVDTSTSSQYHWYIPPAVDPDSGNNVSLNPMMGYSSLENRLIFVDVSVDLMLLDIEANFNLGSYKDLNAKYEFISGIGNRKRAEYLAAIVSSVENEIILQDFTVDPLIQIGSKGISKDYFVDVTVFNNITGLRVENYSWGINEDEILNALSDLLPWASFTLRSHFYNLSSYSGLYYNLKASTEYVVEEDSNQSFTTKKFDKAYVSNYAGLNYFQFLTDEASRVVVDVQTKVKSFLPIFVFLVDNGTFAGPYGTEIESVAETWGSTSPLPSETGSLSLITHTSKELLNQSTGEINLGYSRKILHEIGQHFGISDVVSAGIAGKVFMGALNGHGYFSNFSIFSKDVVRRSILLRILSDAKTMFSDAYSEYVETKTYYEGMELKIISYSTKYSAAITKIDALEFVDAYSDVFDAYEEAFFSQVVVGGAPNIPRAEGLVGLAFFSALIMFIITLATFAKLRFVRGTREKEKIFSLPESFKRRKKGYYEEE